MSEQRTLFDRVGRDTRKIRTTSRRRSTDSEKYRPRGSEAYARKLAANRRWRASQGEEFAERRRRIERNRHKKRQRNPEQRAAHAQRMHELKEYRRSHNLCTYCGKPATEGRRLCQECRDRINANNAKIREAGGERHAKRVAYGRKKSKERKYKRFGMTRESYKAMLAVQGGGCAICGRVHSGHKGHKRLHIDHDHKVQETYGILVVRGILCSRCNTTLGLLQDDPATLRKAAEYLEAAQRRFEELLCHYPV